MPRRPLKIWRRERFESFDVGFEGVEDQVKDTGQRNKFFFFEKKIKIKITFSGTHFIRISLQRLLDRIETRSWTLNETI